MVGVGRSQLRKTISELTAQWLDLSFLVGHQKDAGLIPTWGLEIILGGYGLDKRSTITISKSIMT